MHNTFNGWKKRGRVVAAGERGRYENEYGDKMFHKSQQCLLVASNVSLSIVTIVVAL